VFFFVVALLIAPTVMTSSLVAALCHGVYSRYSVGQGSVRIGRDHDKLTRFDDASGI